MFLRKLFKIQLRIYLLNLIGDINFKLKNIDDFIKFSKNNLKLTF